jgi:hypothetical protein
MSLQQSAMDYNTDLTNSINDRSSLNIILLMTSLGTLLLAMLILFPVVNGVNNTKVSFLSLFIDIPNHRITPLLAKCEIFLNVFYEERTDEIESGDENEDNNLLTGDNSQTKNKRHISNSS